MKPLLCPKCHSAAIELVESSSTTFRINPWELQRTRTESPPTRVAIHCQCGHVHELPGVTSITPALRGRLADNYVSLVTERMLRTPGGKKEGLPHPWAVHPGKHLRDAFLNPRKISVYKLAHATKLSVPRLYDLVKGECWINGMIDLRLCIYFGLQPGYFLHAQLFYLLFRATATKGRAARREVEPLAPTMIPGRHGRPRLASGAVHSLRGSSQSGRPGRGKAAPER